MGADNYCPSCGQENHTHQLPIRHFILELLENTVHFDTKFFRTVRDMFVKPGMLTANYNENQRARYVPPFRLYIFVSAIYFIALSFLDTGLTLKLSSDSSFKLERSPSDSLQTSGSIEMDAELLELSQKDFITDADIEEYLVKKERSVNWLNKKITRSAINLVGKDSQAVAGKVLKNISYLMFLIMPFFAVLLYLVYFRRKMFYTAHLVFSVHLHTLVFILLSVSLLVSMTGLKLTAFAILGSIVYLFIAVRNVYLETWGVTTLKSLVLVAGYAVMLVAGILAAAIASII